MPHTGVSEIGSKLETLTKKEAAALTVRIRSTIRRNARLMKKAWEGEVWVPLGYPTFTAWLTEAVGMTTSRAYQLIAVAVMNDAVHAAVLLPAEFEVSDRQTRDIITIGKNKFIAALREETTDSAEKNVAVVGKTLSILMKAHTETRLTPTPPTRTLTSHRGEQSTPTQVTAPERTPQNLLLLCHAFKAQAIRLPRLQHHTSVQQLRDALTVAKQRLAEFNTAMSNGGISVA